MLTSASPTPFPTAVFLGDSVTTGWHSVTHPRNRWTSLVCEHLRWREVNLAADGLGFFCRRGGNLPGGSRSPSACDKTWLEAVLRCEPDLVTVSLGLNDAALLPSQLELVRQAVAHDLEFLHSRLPGTPVLIAPFFPWLDRGPRFAVVRTMIHDAAAAGLQSTDAASQAVNGEEDKLVGDLVHPNDAGHAAIARAMIALYRSHFPMLCALEHGIDAS
ncbi:SGNH/GDSL hydrolase family protein [Actinomyces trachealis]|uniref:SGNH/GDSL hydrolase family protein n=1 Tax=Actinomyces trachealis TaxID=2763540 RepID=UPI00189298FC|nr:SGNH/GDSL hydrolase family protein [Actinomyces trachealis]